mmetsp:Transcript_11269/g.45822  ORF Transcript_11269/g.45822 Transcript_11269/m.45822 type:complete len:211 (-) Transcript_11269:918-1550(-)
MPSSTVPEKIRAKPTNFSLRSSSSSSATSSTLSAGVTLSAPVSAALRRRSSISSGRRRETSGAESWRRARGLGTATRFAVCITAESTSGTAMTFDTKITTGSSLPCLHSSRDSPMRAWEAASSGEARGGRGRQRRGMREAWAARGLGICSTAICSAAGARGSHRRMTARRRGRQSAFLSLIPRISRGGTVRPSVVVILASFSPSRSWQAA